MEDVEEYGIRDEISVEEFINFIAEEMYPAYPPFMKLFNNDKELIKQKLRENISCIKRVPKDVEEGTKGKYNIKDKSITFYSTKKVSIDDIRKDNNLKHIFVHESIHAVLSRKNTKKQAISGCSYNGKKNKMAIRGAFSKFCKLKGEKGLLKKIRFREDYFKMIDDTSVGTGLNEGFTVWLTEKIIGSEMEMDVYPLEKLYVDIISDLVGEEETIKIASGDYKLIASVLNMSRKELIFFLKSLDVASREAERLQVMKFGENKSKDIDIVINLYDIFHSYALFTFATRFIIPVHLKKIEKGGLNFKDLEMLCLNVSRVRSMNRISKFNKEDRIPKSQDVYMFLDEVLRDEFIEYTNSLSIEDLNDMEILGIDNMYEYIFELSEPLKIEEVDKKFIENIKAKSKQIMAKRAINKKINSFPMEAKNVSMNALVGSIFRAHDICETERKSVNRATRRAMKKQKRDNNHR